MRTQNKIQKEFIPPQNTSTDDVLDHFELNPDMTLYKHVVRGTRYVVLATLEYADASPAYEGDKMLVCLVQSIESNDTLRTDGVIIKANSPDRVIRKSHGCHFMYLGELQCKLPITYGTKVVAYRNIDNNHNWYRPEHEFMDGRFVKIKEE